MFECSTKEEFKLSSKHVTHQIWSWWTKLNPVLLFPNTMKISFSCIVWRKLWRLSTLQQVIVNEGFAVLLLSLVTGDPRDQASCWLVVVRHNKGLLHFVCAKFLINFPVITRMNWNERKCLNWTGKSDKKIFGFDNWASLPRRSCFLNNACWGGHRQAALTVKMVMLKCFFSFVSFSHDFPTLFPREALRLVIWWNTRWWKSALTSQRKIW